MIKSLFDEEENDKKAGKTGKAESGPPSIVAAETEPKEPADETVAEQGSAGSEAASTSSEQVVPFEVDKPIGLPKTDEEFGPADPIYEDPAAIESSAKTPLELKVSELEYELAKLRGQEAAEKPVQVESANAEPEVAKAEPEVAKEVGELAVLTEKTSEPDNKNEVHSKDFVPVSKTATIRNSGLAYSAGIALFGSVVFMLIIGWFADLLLGIQPWGTVIGIVLGAVIGFFQFIRLTSQIINPKPNDFERVSLLNRVGDLEDVEPADPSQAAESIPEKAAAADIGPETVPVGNEARATDFIEVSQTETAKVEEVTSEVTADSSVPESREADGDSVADAEYESEDKVESDILEIPDPDPISKV